MNKKNVIQYLTFSLITSCLFSCLTLASDLKNWIDIDDMEAVNGSYHFLNEDAVKIYLPSVFKKYETAEYQKLLDSLTTKANYQLEIKRLQYLKEMKGNFYIFFDEDTRSTYTVNTMPYMPMHKQDAQYSLGMISLNHKKISKKTNLEFTKIKANYTSNSSAQIFKTIHKIDDKKKQLSSFNSTYIVSANKKTLYIQLLTGFEVNFDPFIQKMII